MYECMISPFCGNTSCNLLQESLIAELRAVNACLEREVGELEEERRRLKAHLKFSAKFQGQIEPDLGLSPEQLSAVEKFVKQLKSKDKVSLLTCRVHVTLDYSESHHCLAGTCLHIATWSAVVNGSNSPRCMASFI